ncbi:MAG: hypothetical protein INR66_03020 [Gordonia polyisoprenivorans]|nr:hypothetical protein [Gordonia polyisoprenivorans]
MPDAVRWIEVLKRLVGGPHVPVQGVISRSGPVESGYVGVVGNVTPLYVGGVDDLEVWRNGRKVRVESATGRPLVIFNGDTVWRFAHNHKLPISGLGREMEYIGPGRELLVTQPASRWVGNDFTEPAGPIREIEYLGRRCWEFELAPPSHKPHPMQMVVDQATGSIMQQRNDAFGVAVRFIEFTAGTPIDEALFEWAGPTRQPDSAPTGDDFRSSFVPSQGLTKDDHQQWFTDHVAQQPLSIAVTFHLEVDRLFSRDGEGSFDAVLSDGRLGQCRLARRPHSDSNWRLPFDRAGVRAWTAGGFDWAVQTHFARLDDNAIRGLQGQLHPDAPITGEPALEGE